jgi:hypothetical protein
MKLFQDVITPKTKKKKSPSRLETLKMEPTAFIAKLLFDMNSTPRLADL